MRPCYDILLRFENGVIIPDKFYAVLPEAFKLTTTEGATFYFRFCDELPSGRILFVETTRVRACRITRGEE